MLKKMRQGVSRVLSGCCAVLWLTGSLSVAQGNLTTQWAASHCPSGQAQHSPHSHHHCTWHCGGLDIQGDGGRGELSAAVHVSRVWSLGAILQQEAVFDGEFQPRGPPQSVPQFA